MIMPYANQNYRHLFVGLDTAVPLYNGTQQPYINLDNAASTPPLAHVQAAINAFLPFYSSVHRGTGFKSQLSTHAYEVARQAVLHFVNADPEVHTCIFGKNTTEAINKLAHRFPFTDERDVVLTSGMEHHSNDLPWRGVAHLIHVGLHPNGGIDLDDFDAKLDQYKDRVALVTVTGGSNVTGMITPIHELAQKAHAVGAQFMVDCAQLAPHRKVEMLALDDPGHLDYIALSAHKMYAPYGVGALIGRRDPFETGDPDMVGGGVVKIVTLDDVAWAEPPERDEAGSPNHVGAIAMAAAASTLLSIGMHTIAAHEGELTAHALRRLREVPGIHIYGDVDPQDVANRLGVISFAIKDIDHFKIAAILGYEFGIGVRNGCFCAHPLILHLLHIPPEEARQVRDEILNGDKSHMPGLIRASFGFYNTTEEIDIFIEALKDIVAGSYRGTYIQDTPSGEFHPLGWKPKFDEYFSIPRTKS
jgi:cysteine desulfurase/selenocysteine lyase